MIRAASSLKLERGRRVRCALHTHGSGIILAVSGTPDAGSVSSIVGVIAMGGRATVDVVFDRGSISRAVPEAIVRGVQWTILDDIATEEEIASALAHAALSKAQASDAAERAEAAHRAALEQLASDPAYAQLEQGSDTSGALAIRNVRRMLKQAFPRCRFSVRKDGYGCFRVAWTDGPSDDAVKPIVERFQRGRFNGMEDIYEADRHNAWCETFGGAKYAFTSRDISAELYDQAIDVLWRDFPANLAQVARPSGEAFKRNGSRARVPGLEEDLDVLIWRVARGLSVG